MGIKPSTIFIPASLNAETKDLRIKTYKVGLIARAVAIFKIHGIVIYSHESEREEAKFISDILTYMNTPQYLRKQVFPITKELRYVGILSPLRTPHHPTGELRAGDFRQGLTIKRIKKGTVVDIGADRLALTKEKLSVNRIISFKVDKLAKEIIITPEEPEVYWGYEVLSTYKSLDESIEVVKPKADLIVGTSRYAEPITSILEEVKEGLKGSKHSAILFGGPYSGLHDIMGNPQGTIDLEVNTIPHQGTETVRTEEAVLATLSVFNVLLNSP